MSNKIIAASLTVLFMIFTTSCNDTSIKDDNTKELIHQIANSVEYSKYKSAISDLAFFHMEYDVDHEALKTVMSSNNGSSKFSDLEPLRVSHIPHGKEWLLLMQNIETTRDNLNERYRYSSLSEESIVSLQTEYSKRGGTFKK